MSKSKQTIIFGTSLVCSLLLSGATSKSFGAVDLTPVFSHAQVVANDKVDNQITTVDDATHASNTSVDGSASGTANVDLTTATLTSHTEAFGAAPFPAGAISTSILDYQLAVIGPGNISVPVGVRARITVDISPHIASDGNGSIQIVQNNGPDILLSDCEITPGPCGVGDAPSVFLNSTAMFESNEPIGVNMFGRADSNEGIVDTTVDPYFFIDPAFLAANPGYSLIFSDGIGNPFIGMPGVPEPAIWTMLILGFGAIGGMLRRSRTYKGHSV